VKVKLWISTLRPRVDGGEYPGGTRVAVSLSKREALLDLCEWAYEDDEHVSEEDEAEGIPDFPNAPEDELEEYLERRRDENAMRSWGIEDIDLELPGTPVEQIAAILKDTCERGDEIHAEELLREARGQFIRESDTHSCPKCGTQHDSTEFEDEGEGDEAGRTFYYCSEACKETH
jgi:DNA-directed RNA polymerase subunit M/transcription elongation factor TFIIS